MRVKFQSRNVKGSLCCGHGNGNFDYDKETRNVSFVRLRSSEERPSSGNFVMKSLTNSGNQLQSASK